MKPPRDHIRLARAFDIPLTKLRTVAWMTGSLGLLGLAAPVFLVTAGGVLAGLGGLSLTDRRAIAKGLAEVEVWGFATAGYRAWLLAEVPVFDIELRREVDVEVVRTSARAIDAAIVVEQHGERVFRFAIPRIALPNTQPHLPPIEVGDRKLLKELHRSILAPLHADVGIVSMSMGDAATLAPLVAREPDEPQAPSGLGGAFRESALAAPPALQALVHVGGDRALPHEARKLRLRSERVMHAANASPSGIGTVSGITVGGLVTGAQFGFAGVWVGAVGGLITGMVTVISGNRQNAKAVARAVANQGYQIEDYHDWLLSGRPLFDVQTRLPIPREWLLEKLARLTAWSVTKKAAVPWVEDVTWLSETLVRIETRPSYIQPPTSRIDPFYGGSHEMFRHFMTEVLAYLHLGSEIVVVRMGGYIDRRI